MSYERPVGRAPGLRRISIVVIWFCMAYKITFYRVCRVVRVFRVFIMFTYAIQTRSITNLTIVTCYTHFAPFGFDPASVPGYA